MLLTWLHLYRSDSVEIAVLSRAVWKLDRVASSHQEGHASLHHRSPSVWKDLTPTRCDDVEIHAFLDAMKRRDWVSTLHAIKPLFPHCQIHIYVVKLETCPMRAITVAMDLARVVKRQCEYIIKIYSVLIFPLVALLHRSLARTLTLSVKGPWKTLTPTRCDVVAMHAFLDAMKRRDWVFTLHAIKPLFAHCQIYICVVKLETCPMRAITVAMNLARVVTRQCEYIIKIYSVLIFPLIALLHRSLTCSPSVWKDLQK